MEVSHFRQIRINRLTCLKRQDTQIRQKIFILKPWLFPSTKLLDIQVWCAFESSVYWQAVILVLGPSACEGLYMKLSKRFRWCRELFDDEWSDRWRLNRSSKLDWRWDLPFWQEIFVSLDVYCKKCSYTYVFRKQVKAY